MVRSRRDGSLTSRLAALGVGESHFECERVPLDGLASQVILLSRNRMNNVLGSLLARVRSQTGQHYTVESTHALLGANAVVVVLAATRVS